MVFVSKVYLAASGAKALLNPQLGCSMLLHPAQVQQHCSFGTCGSMRIAPVLSNVSN